MKQRRAIFCAAVCVMLWLMPIEAKAAAAEAQGRSVISIMEGGREFRVNLDIWQEAAAAARKDRGIVLLLDVSPSMQWLAEEPHDANRLKEDVSYESISAREWFYAQQGDDFKPVALNRGKWCFVDYDEEGNEVFCEEAIGERISGDTVRDRFFQPVWHKGNAKTKLEVVQEAALDFISDLEYFMPGTSLGVIWFSGKVESNIVYLENKAELALLKEKIEVSERMVKAGRDTGGAYEKAVDLIEGWQEVEKGYVITITDGICPPENNPLQYGGMALIPSAVQTIKSYNGEAFLLCLSGQDEKTEAEEKFYRQGTSIGAYTSVTACTEHAIAEALAGMLGKITDTKAVFARCFLNSAFVLDQVERKQMEASGGALTEFSDGTIQIEWMVQQPRQLENPWKREFTVSVKKDFPGGNDLPIFAKDSGIYTNTVLTQPYDFITVNVPVAFAEMDLETEVFLGQTVPGMPDEESLTSYMLGDLPLKWYGLEETGSFSYKWKTSDGAAVGTSEKLMQRKPIESEAFRLYYTYTPKTSGDESIGTANAVQTVVGHYQVNVIKGTVRVKLTADRMEKGVEGGTFVYRLAGNDTIQYRAITDANRSEDGEGVSYEAVFEDIPFGTYELTQVCRTTGDGSFSLTGAEPVQCVVGMKENSDTIDLLRAETVVMPKQLAQASSEIAGGDMENLQFLLRKPKKNSNR